MKLVIRTLVFHIICILIFSLIYYNLAESFYDVHNNKEKTLIDFISLSATIQSSVGLTYLEPITYYSKIAVLLQQVILISINVITIYIFTL